MERVLELSSGKFQFGAVNLLESVQNIETLPESSANSDPVAARSRPLAPGALLLAPGHVHLGRVWGHIEKTGR